MRASTLFAAIAAAFAVSACTYVERTPPAPQAAVVVPQPTVVAPQPAPTVVTPAPTVTVRPSY